MRFSDCTPERRERRAQRLGVLWAGEEEVSQPEEDQKSLGDMVTACGLEGKSEIGQTGGEGREVCERSLRPRLPPLCCRRQSQVCRGGELEARSEGLKY